MAAGSFDLGPGSDLSWREMLGHRISFLAILGVGAILLAVSLERLLTRGDVLVFGFTAILGAVLAGTGLWAYSYARGHRIRELTVASNGIGLRLANGGHKTLDFASPSFGLWIEDRTRWAKPAANPRFAYAVGVARDNFTTSLIQREAFEELLEAFRTHGVAMEETQYERGWKAGDQPTTRFTVVPYRSK